MDSELLAIFDVSGRQVGVKHRAQVHRDGDWHILVFVLSARIKTDGCIRLLLQLRGRPNDPYRGQVDTLAGGHVGVTENHLEGAIRECREEVGLRLEMDEVLYLGKHLLEDPAGVCRRVIQHFYLCRRRIFLSDLAFTGEVNGFVEVDLDEFSELIKGKRQKINAEARLVALGEAIQVIEMTRDVVSAYSDKTLDNFQRAIRAVRLAVTTGQVDTEIWN